MPVLDTATIPFLQRCRDFTKGAKFNILLWEGRVLIPIRQLLSYTENSKASNLRYVYNNKLSVLLTTNAKFVSNTDSTMVRHPKNHLHRISFIPLDTALSHLARQKEMQFFWHTEEEPQIFEQLRNAFGKQNLEVTVEPKWKRQAYKAPDGSLIEENVPQSCISSYDKKRLKKMNRPFKGKVGGESAVDKESRKEKQLGTRRTKNQEEQPEVQNTATTQVTVEESSGVIRVFVPKNSTVQVMYV